MVDAVKIVLMGKGVLMGKLSPLWCVQKLMAVALNSLAARALKDLIKGKDLHSYI